jgi:acylphosphatase
MTIEVHAIVKGRVQGIGFRYVARGIATGLGLHGTVRNMPDGSVEIFAQGDRDTIDKLFQGLKKEFGDRYIDEIVVNERPVNVNDSYDGFTVVR